MKPIAITLWSLLLPVLIAPRVSAQTPTAAAPPDAGIVLRYHLRPGDTRNILFRMDQNIKQVIQGQEMAMKQSLGFGYRVEVLSVDDKGAANTKITYKSVYYKMDSPAANFEYNSSKPDSTPPAGAESFKALLGETMTMTMGPDGQVLKTDGVDAMLKHMLAGANLPDDARASMEKSMKNQFGDQAMKETFEQMTRVYSDQPVKPGSTWTRHSETTKGIALITDSTYVLNSRADGTSKISVKMICKTNTKADPLELGGMKIAYDLSGSMDGKMEVDEATGWARTMKMTQRLSGKMRMTGQQLPQGMLVPITIEGTVSATIQ